MNIDKVARKELRCLVDKEQKKEIQRRIGFRMLPYGSARGIKDSYYDNQDGSLFRTSLTNPTYFIKLRVRNNKELEYIRCYGHLSYSRRIEYKSNTFEKWSEYNEMKQEFTWDEWGLQEVVRSMGPFERKFEVSFTRDCYIDKEGGETIVAFDSEIMYGNEFLFSPDYSLLRIISPHDHPLIIKRMMKTLEIEDDKTSIYKAAI